MITGRLSAAVLVAAVGAACSASSTPSASSRPDEGYMAGPGGRVWYHRVGHGPGTPLVLLHGGPGSTSYGLKPWLALAGERPIVIYDQLGCGKSDRPTDTTLFTLEHYASELQMLRDSLGLTEIHLYGRSWGAMLAEAYMRSRPAGIKSLILSSPLVTTAQWEHDADSLLRALPDSFRTMIAKHEADHTYDAPEYVAATNAYYKLYLTRRPPQSKADADSEAAGFGQLVYRYMWGPSEFTSTGTLKHFDATSWLRAVTVPTLFLSGEFDEAVPASTRRFSALVPGAEYALILGSAHVTENDNPEALFRVVRDFLARAEKR